MNCEQVAPYLPGLAGDDLKPETVSWIEDHLAACTSCSAQADRQRRVAAVLGELRGREIEPPAYLVEAVMEHARGRRRFLPVPPVPPQELIRVVQENREAIASVVGATIVTAGAAYALWRALRSPRPAPQPAR